MYPHRTTYTVAIILVFVLVIAIARHRGTANRVTLPSPRVLTVQTPDQAFTAWQETGVRGRILILFDNYPHMKGLRNYQDTPQLTPWNLVEYAIFKNIVRRIYLVVPDENWNELADQKEKRPIRNVPGMDRGIYLSTLSGIPFIATTMQAIGPLSEDVLVYINTTLFDEGRVTEVLKRKMIRSDLIIRYRSTPR